MRLTRTTIVTLTAFLTAGTVSAQGQTDSGWVEIANYMDDFSIEQGNNGWRYQFDQPSASIGITELPNVNVEDEINWYRNCGQVYGCYPRAMASNIHPGVKSDERCIVTWQAENPVMARIILSGALEVGCADSDDGATVELIVDDVLLESRDIPPGGALSLDEIIEIENTVRVRISKKGNGLCDQLLVSEWKILISDCNDDGLGDQEQILDGSLFDRNQNGIPDCCDSDSPCEMLVRQWSESEGGNGHWYATVPLGVEDNWDEADAMARAMGGHLATITTQAENTFLYDFISEFHVGSNCSIGGLKDPDGDWRWITGESWAYTNWQSGEPGCCLPNEYWLDFNVGSGEWRDSQLVVAQFQDVLHPGIALIEWSDDCNGDSIIDYGQILDGTIEDSDGNGIPDCCADGSCPVQWRIEDGGNGHWYQYVNNTEGQEFIWSEAREAALSMGADLVSLETIEEWEFFCQVTNCGPEGVTGGWIGLVRSTADSDQWYWLTDDLLDYDRWRNPDEPNPDTNENRGIIIPSWDQTPYNAFATNNENNPNNDFFIEWSADCNGDGIVDYGQILDGTLMDLNVNVIPDCCVDASCLAAVQWRGEDGGNGHWYQAIPAVNFECWNTLKDDAEDLGGHLATITTPVEQTFVADYVGPLYPVLGGSSIGGYQDINDPEYSEPGGAWKWVTGEPFDYTNWQPGEPGCCGPYEKQNWLDFNPGNGQWRDRFDCVTDSNNNFMIVEWSDDCNDDGIVDYGQVLDGSLGDLNNDGIPDVCNFNVGDLNLDGCVDGSDLATLLALWGLSNPPVGDLNGDGIVAGQDLATLLANWEPCP